MKKLGLIGAAIFAGGLSLSAPSFAQENGRHVTVKAHHSYRQRATESGPYHQDRLPDGTLTGPLTSDNTNG